MSNTLTYGSYTFDDDSIYSINISTEMDLIGAELSADTITAVIKSDKAGDKKLFTVMMDWYHTVNDQGFVIADDDLTDYVYGTALCYYKDNVLKKLIKCRQGSILFFCCR